MPEPNRWFLHRDGEKIEATPERWQWVAIYTDGSVLKQFDDDRVFHWFKEIDQSRLAAFAMVNAEFPTAAPISFPFKPGMKLIHFYRNICLRKGQPDETHIRLYCAGYQRGTETMMIVIAPNNEIFIVEDVSEVPVG
jgi:hypothetical protein